MACGVPRGMMLREPAATCVDSSPRTRTDPSPATTYRISSRSLCVCSAIASCSCSKRVVEPLRHPKTDSLSGSRPMKFLSRNRGIDTKTGGPDGTGGGGGGASTTGGGGGGGGSSGFGMIRNAAKISAGCPARTVTSRSNVTYPSSSNRKRYMPSFNGPIDAVPFSSVVASRLAGPATMTWAPGSGVPLTSRTTTCAVVGRGAAARRGGACCVAGGVCWVLGGACGAVAGGFC
jgi:hypothetical protein